MMGEPPSLIPYSQASPIDVAVGYAKIYKFIGWSGRLRGVRPSAGT